MDQMRRNLLTPRKLAVKAVLSTAFTAIVFSLYLLVANTAPTGNDFTDAYLAEGSDTILTPTEHIRPADQTFLTFPEWFLVHSPREYATFLLNGRPSEFPYFRHIGQFWQSYRKVAAITNQHFAFNTEYHIMIMVIGVSTTVEYALKGAYETMVGRSLEAWSIDTPEDRLFAKGAKDYVDFIDVDPWYKFDFMQYVTLLWSQTGVSLVALPRSLERRYIMTTEYLVKGVYGWIIGKATAASFEKPRHETAVIMLDNPALAGTGDSQITWQSPPVPGYSLAMLPRYQAFTDKSLALANAGAEFVEIAGNRGPIMVSILTPREWKPRDSNYDVVFSQPIITAKNKKRIVIATPVKNLAAVLREYSAAGLQIEHVYDF